MPELSEVRMMRDHALQKNIIGKRVKYWQRFPRTKEDGTNYASDIGDDLAPVIGCTITRIVLRGKAFIIELASEKGKSLCVRYKFGLGSILSFLPFKDNEVSFPIKRRINQFWIFSDYDLAWTLVDCATYVNFARWRLYLGKKITDLTVKEIGHFDPINNPNEWRRHIQDNQGDINKQVQGFSAAKLLSYEPLFNGVGSYLSSEILHRLHTIYKIPPWAEAGRISFQPEESSTFINLVAILRTLVEHISWWSKRFESIAIHDASGNRSFYLSLLEAYRKKGTSHWVFTAVGGKRQAIYTFCSDPKMYAFFDNPNTADDNLLRKEKWTQQSEELNKSAWVPNTTGVGPLAWHCLDDFPFLTIRGNITPQANEEANEIEDKQPEQPEVKNKAKRKRSQLPRLSPQKKMKNRFIQDCKTASDALCENVSL